VNVIALTVKLSQFSIELVQYMDKDFFQGRQGFAVKYMLPVFGNKHQQKFSNNWKKQKQAVSKIHIKIADARNDFLQKLSTIMGKNHAVIVAEDLRIKNMSASAKGDMEKPGKNVNAKAGLNKSILDQGWGNFLRMIGYKQEWSGGVFLQVDPKNTSRTCPACGHVSADNRKSQALFICTECGHSANVDYVGAVNVKVRGIEVLKAAGHCRDSLWRENISSPTKQEPADPGNRDLCLNPA
jgi:putative transposase